MPKRSRNGRVISPERVVAPTSVKGGRSIRIDRAAGPSPMIRSSWKSSIAGIEDFLHRRRQPVDLVDEQHVARLQVGQQCREVAGPLDHRPRGRAEADPELARDDLRQRRLAEPGRAEKQHMVERLAPAFRGLDEHPQIVAQLPLADELVERQRPDRGFGRIPSPCSAATIASARVVAALRPLPSPVWPSSCSPAVISASTAAPSPSRRAAAVTAP